MGFLCLCILVIAMLSACGKSNTTTPSPTPTTEAGGETAQAETIYKQNCVSCHGTDLEGKMGGKTNLQHVGGSLSKDKIFNQISNGGGGMMAFKGKLTDTEITALADWLAAKK
ncbi:c-type cytochrome [Paenibacillus montanisoli]|uniref:Cytochrome c n=1 Tax=Paenibacillus montanisoli TaxID=2081970 RepID=A0A328U2I9_9BACL|nr:cytochrome c [Paenibacillus montanisoli]RAP76910.1 cytochrome c [Paenibacillus montanisoli]